jgi:hypothetical protein
MKQNEEDGGNGLGLEYIQLTIYHTRRIMKNGEWAFT